MDYKQRKARIAYHEAGHVVANHLFKIAFDKVGIWRNGGHFEGEVENSDQFLVPNSPNTVRIYSDSMSFTTITRDRAEEYIMSKLAGGAAAHLYLGHRPPWIDLNCDWVGCTHLSLYEPRSEEQLVQDSEAVRLLLLDGCFKYETMYEKIAYLEWLYLRVKNILKEPANWNAIKAVAEALLAKNTLTYLETTEIIECAMRKPAARVEAQA